MRLPAAGHPPFARCPVCGQDAAHWRSATDLNRRITAEVFHYYRCASCRTLFLAPVPANLGHYYPPDYYSLPRSVAELDARSASERYKIELIQSFGAGPRLLEIGPATGYFARLAQRAGFVVHVVEADAACCEFLRETVGLEVTHSAAVSAALEPGRLYDVIALWQVVEHLPDPVAELAALSRHLAPGGMLVVSAPNPESLQARALGRYWTHLDAPRHLTLVPPMTLVERLAALGLPCKLVTATDPGSLGWNTFGWQFSLANLMRWRPLTRVARIAGALLTRLLIPVERVGLKGAAYTLVLRKDPAAR